MATGSHKAAGWENGTLRPFSLRDIIFVSVFALVLARATKVIVFDVLGYVASLDLGLVLVEAEVNSSVDAGVGDVIRNLPDFRVLKDYTRERRK
jgi:hypothetical protein